MAAVGMEVAVQVVAEAEAVMEGWVEDGDSTLVVRAVAPVGGAREVVAGAGVARAAAVLAVAVMGVGAWVGGATGWVVLEVAAWVEAAQVEEAWEGAEGAEVVAVHTGHCHPQTSGYAPCTCHRRS